jgi:large subunit ribosomal protein L11
MAVVIKRSKRYKKAAEKAITTPVAIDAAVDAVKAEKGSGEPNKNKIGKLTMAQCIELAKEKGKDLNAFDPVAAGKILAGTARSMGITV